MSNATSQSTLSPPPQRPRPQYSLYDNVRCTGDAEPPHCDLPMEVVCNIFDFANFTCAMSAAASAWRLRVLRNQSVEGPRHREDVASIDGVEVDAGCLGLTKTPPTTQVREEALPLDD